VTELHEGDSLRWPFVTPVDNVTTRHRVTDPSSNDSQDANEVPNFRSGKIGRPVVIAVVIIVAALGLAIVAVAMPSRAERHQRAVERAHSSDNQEGGGCPCGCDHSQQMIAELRELPSNAALRTVDASLDAIAARETTAYVTEAQIEHRLNLLEFRRELAVEPRPPSPVVSWPRGQRAEDGTLSVLTELVVHGEATEIIHGRPKLQRAHFVVRLTLKNLSASRRVLEPPRVVAAVAMPVSRWYVVGTDGRPWDGLLNPGEERRVHAIGYLTEPVRPGSEIDATVSIGQMATRATVRARARWDSDTE
jgi:hypothetical protein